MKKTLHCVGRLLSGTLILLLLTTISLQVRSQASALIKFGNSYVNLSKRQSGGTVQNGDTLEVRTTIYINQDYNGVGNGRVYYIRYLDNLPSHTIILPADNLRVVTNEGLTYKSYTYGLADDAGAYNGTPAAGEFQVRINLGGAPSFAAPGIPVNNTIADLTGASNIRASGTVAQRNKPRGGSGVLFSTSFKVKVNGAVGDTITLGAGQIRYKKNNLVGDPDTVLNAIQYKILISNPSAFCPTSLGSNFANEFSGTFGNSNTINRSTGPTFLIPGYTYVPNMSRTVAVGDGFYAIVNNTSPLGSTNVNARRQPNCAAPLPIPVLDTCVNRMFNGFWDIHGDHSGTSTAAGNSPVANGSSGGYMLMVNADLATSEAYRQTITGLCPQTNYEFSAWIKNVCKVCGIDSTGASTYKPGVYPNLTFVVDGIDRFSSGEMDTVGWMKKGGLITTGPGQDSIVISIRNNAPGGGGNDWVLDDIGLSVCQPTIDFTAYPIYSACTGDVVAVDASVLSNYSNYSQYKWQISSDNGSTWTETGVNGSGTPAWNGSQYQYDISYPPFIGATTDSGKIFRVVVATNPSNLSDPTCSFSDAAGLLGVNVHDCIILPNFLTSINGSNASNFAQLRWTTENESAPYKYIVERSSDGIHFSPIGTVNGNYTSRAISSEYQFNDPKVMTGVTYYRLRITTSTNRKVQFSKVVLLSSGLLPFTIKNVTNPVTSNIKFDAYMPEKGEVTLTIMDNYGRVVMNRRVTFDKGLNTYMLDGLDKLSKGVYVMRAVYQNQQVNNRISKY